MSSQPLHSVSQRFGPLFATAWYVEQNAEAVDGKKKALAHYLEHGWREGRNPHPLPYALVGVAVIVGVIVWLKPAPQPVAAAQPAAAAPVAYADVQKVLEQRCYMCHGAQVQMKNVRLDTPQALKQHAQAVYQQAVVTKVMPMNNSTGITDAARALIGRWFQAGARVE